MDFWSVVIAVFGDLPPLARLAVVLLCATPIYFIPKTLRALSSYNRDEMETRKIQADIEMDLTEGYKKLVADLRALHDDMKKENEELKEATTKLLHDARVMHEALRKCIKTLREHDIPTAEIPAIPELKTY